MQLNTELELLMKQFDDMFDPTKDMTPLERYIFETTAASEMYCGMNGSQDPFDVVSQLEESEIAYFGHNLNERNAK